MNEKVKAILALIEEARGERAISNETANLATTAFSLEGDEVILANRIISRGSDPASLEYVLSGQISEPTRRAHFNGPGALSAEERDPWLVLAAASIDESEKEGMGVVQKVQQFIDAITWLRSATEDEKRAAAEAELRKILSLPFEQEEVGGIPMRVYLTDRGFAAAYWSGIEFAAVRTPKTIYIGSQGRSLEEIGVKVHRALSPTFGLIFI